MALTGTETSVTCHSTLTLARETLAEERFDLLILDINLPDGSGLDLLRQVRSEGDTTPVILLTANDLELDEVTGLEAGADDYITKPFSLAVLRARVNAQLRRGTPKAPALSVGPFAFDFDRMDFRRDGVSVELSQNGAEAPAGAGGKSGTYRASGHTGGPGMDGRRGICGGKRPVRHGQAAAEQAGGRPLQAGISENGVRHRLHLGGEAMTGYVIAGIALLLALAVVAYDRWRTACTIRRLDDMLTAAMNGSFSKQNFDESRLSALESRLGRYLTASALSERNVREQKDQISALISDISHQTKTPVANLQLYAQLLSEQPLTPQGKDCRRHLRSGGKTSEAH